MFKVIVLTFLALTFVSAELNPIYQQESRIIDNLLSKYDGRVPPVVINSTSGVSSGVVVRTNLYVRSIDYINTNDQTYQMQITFRQSWHDERLKYDDMGGKLKYITIRDSQKVWKPDTFFTNEKTGHIHDITMPNVLFRVHPDGTVFMSTRLTLQMECPMDLARFPFDRQVCEMKVASYGYTTNEIIMEWKEDPVQFGSGINLLSFKMEKFDTDYCTSSTKTGEYSCLLLKMKFKREAKTYMRDWYCPTAAITLLSFISFWMNPRKSARIIVLIAVLLFYWHKVEVINQELPKVNYKVYYECWSCTCSMFIVAALLEHGLVCCMQKCRRKDTHRDSEDSATNEKLIEDGSSDGALTSDKKCKCAARDLLTRFKQMPRSHVIDICSRFMFPLMFLVYSMVYFFFLCFKKEQDTM